MGEDNLQEKEEEVLVEGEETAGGKETIFVLDNNNKNDEDNLINGEQIMIDFSYRKDNDRADDNEGRPMENVPNKGKNEEVYDDEKKILRSLLDSEDRDFSVKGRGKERSEEEEEEEEEKEIEPKGQEENKN